MPPTLCDWRAKPNAKAKREATPVNASRDDGVRKPDAGNPPVRFDEGRGWRRSLALCLSSRATPPTLHLPSVPMRDHHPSAQPQLPFCVPCAPLRPFALRSHQVGLAWIWLDLPSAPMPHHPPLCFLFVLYVPFCGHSFFDPISLNAHRSSAS